MNDSPETVSRFASPAPLSLEYAGFWLRAGAGAIDVGLEFVVALLISLVIDVICRRFAQPLGITPAKSAFFTGMAFIVLLTVGAWLYVAFMESSAWRATVGKRLMGLQVVTALGDRLTFGQATVRHLMKFLSLFTLSLGFMMAGWTKRHQALHDMPVDCVVIRVPERSFSLLHR